MMFVEQSLTLPGSAQNIFDRLQQNMFLMYLAIYNSGIIVFVINCSSVMNISEAYFFNILQDAGRKVEACLVHKDKK